MAHFLVLSQVFPPDAVSTAQVMGEICEDLAAAGHQITVLTTTPHYNPDGSSDGRHPVLPTWIPFIRKSQLGGVRVWHVMMPRRSRHPAARLVAWAWYHLASTALAFALRRADAILACSPPLTIGVSSWLIGLVHRAPFVYSVQELYPDIAARLGVIRRGMLLEALLGLEKFVYRKAARVTTISPGMRRRILEKGVPESKALLIPNFVDLTALRPLPKDNPFARQHGLVDKFVVSYAGNLGLAQGLETVLAAADRLRNESGICFVIMGGGLLKESIRRRVDDDALTNVLLLPYQPFERMSEVYGASDLNLVPLAAEAGADALPSKIYRILACGRPILAIADSDSDLGAFVRESGCGMVVPPGDSFILGEAVRAAARDRSDLATVTPGRSPDVVAQYSRPGVTARYRRLLEGLATRNADDEETPDLA